MPSNTYKAIFGIVTSYAREDSSLKQEDWKNLQSNMSSAVSAYNNKHPHDKLDWNNLPPDLAAGKTMVFTILNRNLLGGITQKLGSVFGNASPSGRASGPHLHYEIIHRGKQIDPLKFKVPSYLKLKGTNLEKFKERKIELDNLLTGQS